MLYLGPAIFPFLRIVLIIYYCVTNHHNLSGLKYHSFIISDSMEFQESRHFCSLSHKTGESRYQPGLWSYLRLSVPFQAYIHFPRFANFSGYLLLQVSELKENLSFYWKIIHIPHILSISSIQFNDF